MCIRDRSNAPTMLVLGVCQPFDTISSKAWYSISCLLYTSRFKLIDMKGTATSYASGNPDIVTRETYDKLVKALKKLNDILKIE